MKMKRKGIILASAILGSVAVVSTGFAAWVISTPTSTAVTGNIQVETVSQDATQFGFEWVGNNQTLHFGAPAATIEGAWLTNNDLGKEDLEATFTVSVSKKTGTETEYSPATGKVKVTLQLGTTSQVQGKTVFNDDTANILAATSTYFNLPTDFAADGHYKEYDLVGGKATINATFTWGSAFNNKNPYNYYNEQSYSDDLGTEAYTALDALNTALAGKVFNFKVELVA